MADNNVSPGAKNRQAQAKSTQTHLRIAEIRDNIVVLKNGGLRTVLKTNSINFNLKSEEEQNAIISSYQGFLNSLEFPIQIIVRSKKLDIDDYIDEVRKIGNDQKNKLLQEQTYEYADYIQKLVEYADIMAKEFFVVIPYDPGRTQGANKFNSFFQRLAPKDTVADIKKRHTEFEELSKKLLQRSGIVQAGLENCGLKVEEANTSDLIEIFYKSYNPLSSLSTKVKDPESTSIKTDQERQIELGT